MSITLNTFKDANNFLNIQSSENVWLSSYRDSHTKSLTGGLVFTRLKDKSAVVQGHVTMPLRSDFTPEDVPDSAKETASNWFYKVLQAFLA